MLLNWKVHVNIATGIRRKIVPRQKPYFQRLTIENRPYPNTFERRYLLASGLSLDHFRSETRRWGPMGLVSIFSESKNAWIQQLSCPIVSSNEKWKCFRDATDRETSGRRTSPRTANLLSFPRISLFLCWLRNFYDTKRVTNKTALSDGAGRKANVLVRFRIINHTFLTWAN